MRGVCSIADCEGKRHGHGLCFKHYKRWRVHGDPSVVLIRRIEPGERFGRLIVLHSDGSRNGNRAFACQCDCGGVVSEVLGCNLRSGRTVSCGCRKTTHGHAGTRTYRSWAAARYRCTDPDRPDYDRYGGRGIAFCSRWREPDGRGFLNFLADMGERPEGTSIDRIDPDGNYEPDNCRWATAVEQRANRRR